MLKIPYQAIRNGQTREEFDAYIKRLNIPIIDYIAIGLQCLVNKKSISLKSNCNFQKIFSEFELADYDPIRKAIWQTNATFFTFDSVANGDSMGKVVMKYREKFNIHNGIIYTDKNETHRYVLTLATGYKKLDGYKFFIENKPAINTVFEDLKKIIDLSMV